MTLFLLCMCRTAVQSVATVLDRAFVGGVSLLADGFITRSRIMGGIWVASPSVTGLVVPARVVSRSKILQDWTGCVGDDRI